MNINIKLDHNFTAAFNKALSERPELAKLNGFSESQLNYTDFIDSFIDKNSISDTSIDANSNVATKDVCSLLSEQNKPHMKLLAFNKVFYEMNKKWGFQTANDWFRGEYEGQFYLHDAPSSTYVPYCYAYDLDRLAREGLYFIEDSFNAQPPKHLTTWTDFVGEFVSWTSNRSSGACGLPSFLVYSYYFWKKDIEAGYYLVNPEYYRDQEFQRIVYKLNQPYLRVNQSAFTNFSIFDRSYLVELFGGKEFPDGSFMIDSIDEILEYQKRFMEKLGAIREVNSMTFPVMSYSLLFQNGKFVNEDYAKWCCKQNMRWAESNFATFDDVTSLSNCCRLVSDIKQLGYFNSIGGTALEVGSVKVNTINLARISYESESKGQYLDIVKSRVTLACKTLHTIRSIIKRNTEKNLLPNYSQGIMSMENQYNTVGIIGLYETIEKFGLIRVDELGYHYYTDEGLDFAKEILAAISDATNAFREENQVDYLINIEQVPAERAADILMQKDKFFFPNQRYTLPLYGNQWFPLGVRCTMQEKIRVTAILDKACNGGAIGHFNIETPFKTFEDAWEALNYVARSGIKYFAFCYRIAVCRSNHSFFGDACPICGEPVYTTVQRVVGFLVPEKNMSIPRQSEYSLRTFF